MATILKTNRNRNPPKKKFFKFPILPMPRTSQPSIACFPLEIHPAHVPHRLVSPPFSAATPASSGSFHCMLPLGYPSDSSLAVYPLVPALQLQHRRRFHCCRFHLAIHPVQFLTGCISAIPSLQFQPRRRFHCPRFHLFQLCNSSIDGELPFPLPSFPSQARPRAEPPLSPPPLPPLVAEWVGGQRR